MRQKHERWDEQWKLPLGARRGLLHSRVEVGVAEEVQGATENHSGIVSGLKAGDQQGVLANSMGVLEREREKKGLVRDKANDVKPRVLFYSDNIRPSMTELQQILIAQDIEGSL